MAVGNNRSMARIVIPHLMFQHLGPFSFADIELENPSFEKIVAGSATEHGSDDSSVS